MNRRELFKGLVGLAVAPTAVAVPVAKALPAASSLRYLHVTPRVPEELGKWLGRKKSEEMALAFLHQDRPSHSRRLYY